MIGVARHAVLRRQALMKRPDCGRTRQGGARGLAQSDICDRVARDASLRHRAAEGRMAGETVRFETCVRGDERSGSDHEVRVKKSQHGKPDEVGRDDEENPASLHFHPQNRKMLTIWPTARTAKARAIG